MPILKVIAIPEDNLHNMLLILNQHNEKTIKKNIFFINYFYDYRLKFANSSS